MNEIESLNKKIDKLRKQKEKYVKEHSVKNLRAEYVGCRKCGSKLKVSLLRGENCPLCNTDLKSKTVMEKIKEFDSNIKNLFYEKTDLEENSLRIKKGTFDLRDSVEPRKEVDKKILKFLQEKYKGEFRFAECCEGKNYIFVSCRDFIHAKKYFSAYFDAFVFDKEGKLICSTPRYIEGDAYSSFFIDKVEFDGDGFKIFVRSHIHSYSKCDDEYLAVWKIDILSFDSSYKMVSVTKNPFIFKDRRSERYISVSNQSFYNSNGQYYIYEDTKGYSIEELSLNYNLRVKLEKELKGEC